MGTELEWKYAADEKTLRLVAERYGGQNWRVIEMESLYFDTPARDLGQRRWTLRLRRENGVGVVCLKTPGTGRARGEWEVRCEDPRAALPLLAAEGAPSELAALTGGQTLEPVCGARFTRRAALLPLPGDGTVELCLASRKKRSVSPRRWPPNMACGRSRRANSGGLPVSLDRVAKPAGAID